MPVRIPAPYWYDMIYPIMAHRTLLELGQKMLVQWLTHPLYPTNTNKTPYTVHNNLALKMLAKIGINGVGAKFTVMGTMIHLQY